MKLKFALSSVALIVIFSTVSFSQNDWLAERIAADNAITNQLRQEGAKYETKRAILWVEKDSLTQEEIKDFGALVHQGIIDIEKYTNTKFDKKHYQTNKVEYFLSSKAGIPHVFIGNKPFVYLTPARVKNKRTAYLHETSHIINWKTSETTWLYEGFASHVQSYVSKHYGGYMSYAFNPENKPIDELAVNLLKNEISKKVLPLIGLNGNILTWTPEQARIYLDRDVGAPAFYNLSESFVKFLVEKIGTKKMKKIFEVQDTRTGIERITGRNVDEWKTDWLKSLAE